MSSGTELETNRQQAASRCLARAVLTALSEDPTLEAVTIDRDRKTISVATLGKTNIPELTQRITSTFRRAQETRAEQHCSLLLGEGQCESCGEPLSELQRQRKSISNTTGRRPPSRGSPARRLQSSGVGVMFPGRGLFSEMSSSLEHAEEIDAWEPQLAAAVLCGLFGLGAFYFRASPLAVVGYLLAYVAGGWFTAQEVWERLQKRAIDVHFLMLAVAAGSASIGAWGEGAMLLFLFSFSGALEHFALGRTQREIRSLFRQVPKFATVIDERGRRNRSREIDAGHAIVDQTGRAVSCRCRNPQRPYASDESNLTGEATPGKRVR